MAEKTQRFRTIEETHVRPDTGEMYSVVVTRPIGGNPGWNAAKNRRFAMGNPEALAQVQMRGSDWRIFWRLVDMAQFDTGLVNYRMADIQLLDTHGGRVAASQSVKRLVDIGVVRRVARGVVQINPDYVWIGKKAAATVGYRNGESEDD